MSRPTRSEAKGPGEAKQEHRATGVDVDAVAERASGLCDLVLEQSPDANFTLPLIACDAAPKHPMRA